MKNLNYKTHIISVAVAFSLLLLCNYSVEASPADSFLDRLQGTWQGDGKAFGGSASLNMKWEWVLGRKFLRLSLRTETQSATGQLRAFEGHAYYRLASEGRCEGEWFDSRGVSFSIKGNIEVTR